MGPGRVLGTNELKDTTGDSPDFGGSTKIDPVNWNPPIQWPIMDAVAMTNLAEAINNHADAIRELAAAMNPPKEAEPDWRCEHCGSPKWIPGGMGMEFKKCEDCGKIGESIKNESGDD